MTRTPSDRRSAGFRPDIEGLRGIAVLLVVLYHARVPYLTGGFIGVDVFFVISGYLITGLLFRELTNTGRINFTSFYARRVRRLLPAAVLTILVTVVASYFVYAAYEQIPIIKTAITTALYSCNVYFAHHATDYLAAPADTNPFLHMWSLAVEEQFYLVWPLMIWLGFRCFPGKEGRRLPLLLGGMAVLSFVVCLWLTYRAQPWAFFSSPTRAWEFAIGGLAQFQSKRSWPRVFAAGPLLGLLAVIGCAVLYSGATRFPGLAALVPVLGAAIILQLPSRQEGVRWLLENPVTQFLGRMSYSWYLWHWPVLVLCAAVWPLTLAERLFCALVALLMAFITYRAVENPVRFNRFLVTRSWMSLGMAACLMCVTVSVCLATAYAGKRFENARSKQLGSVIAALPVVYANGCHLTFSVTVSPDCSFADTKSNTAIVLFGDSHAAQWFPPLERIADDNHWKLVSLTKSSCTASSVITFDELLRRNYTECEQWRDKTLDRIVAMHPALVVVTDFTALYVREGMSVPMWGRGLRSTLSRLDQAGIQTLLLHDPPAPTVDLETCLARAARTGRSVDACRYRRNLSLNGSIQVAEMQAVRGLSHTTLLDISDHFCTQEPCSPVRNGTIVYRDPSHVTVSFALTMVPYFHQEVESAMLDAPPVMPKSVQRLPVHLHHMH